MADAIRVAVNGAGGRMGQLVLAAAAADPRCGAIVPCGRDTDWQRLVPVDVVIDFSSPAGFSAALDHCLRTGCAFVSGTTGLDAAVDHLLDATRARVASLYAANFSLGVALLTRLVAEAAAAVPGWDLEIIEAHHSAKRDAPSGTALALGRAAATARGQDLDAVAARGRDGVREPGSIGFASLRGGDIVGEHTALLATRGERIELTHRATDRAIFARGAVAAAVWLAGRAPGRYTLADVVAGRDA